MVTLKSQAYSHIRSRIAKGLLRAGDKLSPIELGKEIGISHIPVREAISQLESEGIVIRLERQGSFIRELSRKEVLDLVDFRSILEQESIGLAAERISRDEIDSLEEYLRQLKEVVGKLDEVKEETEVMPLMGLWMLTDFAFHLLLLRAAGNQEIVKVVCEKQIMLQMFAYHSNPSGSWFDTFTCNVRNFDVHQQIFQAVKKRDLKAAYKAMAMHNELERKDFVQQLDLLEKKKTKPKTLFQSFPESMHHIVDSVQHQFMNGPDANGK